MQERVVVECNLRAWRERLGLSQVKAAKELGCSRKSIMAWETAGTCPRYIALAARALANGLKGWGHQDG